MYVKDKYDYNFSNETIIDYLTLMKNNIYKLLPLREENNEWKKYLETLIELELKGCKILFTNIKFVSLITKLCSLYDKNFYLYRKGIFESLKIVDSIINELKENGEKNE